MGANDRMDRGRSITVFRVQQGLIRPAATVTKCAVDSVESGLEPFRQSLVSGIATGEQRIATGIGDRQSVQLGRLERHRIISAIGMPTLGAAAIDRLI